MEYLNSVGTGAVDTMRGVAGFETGRWEAYTVEFAAPTLGLVFNDDGCVSSLQPGGEAERRGVRLNDSVTHINGAPVGDRSQSALHLALGSVNFRLDEESAKAESILTIMLDSPIAGPHPHVIKHCAGLAFLRVTRVAFQAGVSWGTGCVVARLPGGGWSPPSAIGTAGASFGWQIGAEVADFVVSKGLFAGISLDGSEINERNAVNERHYARPGVRAADILSGAEPAAYAQPPPPVYAPPPPPAPQPMSEEQQVAEAMRRSMQDQ
ncbi:hypothetical protein JL720_11393 [Aureococcus anophagefferens]|nr:hypothetical protein JL720_11393 [Aureococcus anophagefferens]